MELTESEKFDSISREISDLFSTAVKERKQHEERMLRNLRQYMSEYEPNEKPKPGGSTLFTNITRAKVEAAKNRMVRLLLPNGEDNWGITPTPVPELEAKADSKAEIDIDETRYATEGDVVASAKEDLQKKSDRMADVIADQLAESNYDAVQRQVIFDACKLGTGVLKGPILIGEERRVWRQNAETGQMGLEIVRTVEPRTKRVNPFYWFPDMSATQPNERDYDFELSFMTRHGVRELMKYPHYRKEQVEKVLKLDPKETQDHQLDFIDQLRSIADAYCGNTDNRYHCIEYYGPIKREWLIQCGCNEDDLDESEPEPYGLMLLIGGHVVMADVHPMSKGESIYDSFNWEEDEGSLFGFGVPDQMRAQQETCNAAMRMMLDNAGASSGPQIIYDDRYITPVDGGYQLSPRKFWRFDPKGNDNVTAAQAFTIINIPTNIQESMALFDKAQKLADEVTGLPAIAQGEQGSGVTKTFQGMALLMESANVNIAGAVKLYDDRITTPHITRYYDWNMEFNEDSEIKGDVQVVAKGTTALLARERKIVEIQNLIQIAGSMFAQVADMEKIFKEYLRLNDFEPDAYILKQAEPDPNAPPSPEEQAAMAQQQLQELDVRFRDAELQIRAKELDIRAFEAETAREIKMTDIGVKQKVAEDKQTFENIKHDNELDMREFEQYMESQRQQNEIAIKRLTGSGL